MILLLFTNFVYIAVASTVRICVPESKSQSCETMVQDLLRINETLSCVTAPDMFECLRLVSEGDADAANTDGSGIYVGGKLFNLQPILTEYVEGQPFRYPGIAVVSKNSKAESASDLRGLRSCHTGLGKTTGWKIPVARLLSSGLMRPVCGESELEAIQAFFNGSCVPGAWSKDKEIDRMLKQKHRRLCSLCKDPSTCSSEDAYAGYEGALRCLSEGAGDVAFTKLPALRDYLAKNPDFGEQADILCFDGGRHSVSDNNLSDSCTWGHRPSNAFVAGSDADHQESIASDLLSLQSKILEEFPLTPDWFHDVFLSHPKVDSFKRTEENQRTYEGYLGDFVHALHKPRQGCQNTAANSATFCLTSSAEASKCEDLSKVAESQGLWPDVRCVTAPSKAACMENLKEGNADLLVLDGTDVYKAGRYFGHQPIASELYGESDASYYAVAVIRSASDVTKLADLRGLRSCHTGLGRTAGWVMPVGAMLSAGLIPEDGPCNRAGAVAEFFSAGSCVPGASDPKYNPGRRDSETLCKHCVGDDQGENKCSRGPSERYSSYAGAFRCLAEGAGDVAFVKHATAPGHTDGRGAEGWTKDLRSDDFALLCDAGGTDSVFNYSYCNLGRVPAHQVVIKGGLEENRRLNLAKLLTDMSSMFSKDSNFYRLFRKGYLPDLLFKDSATGIRAIPFKKTYEQILGKRFLKACRLADPKECNESL